MAGKGLDEDGSFGSSTSSSQPEPNGFDVDMDDSGFSGAQAVATVRDVHRKLKPLQAEADRLGKQVESFAEALDRLGSKIHEKPSADCTQVLPLIKEYETVAKKTVAQLREIHDPNGKRQRQSEWQGRLRRPLQDDILGTTTEDVKWWEQEQQTWNLLGRIIQTQYPLKHKNPVQSPAGLISRPRKNPDVHRYSSEQTLWQNFLAEDDTAWERHLVLEWLKSGADDLNPPVEDVIEQSSHASLKGRRVGAKGWESSKGVIKSQKRLRSWPTFLDPSSPGIDKFNFKTSKTSDLVTQLDPDAVTRQARDLDAQDNTFERAAWIACWEMLRRGRTWNQIRAWCKDRTDIWRAISIRGELQIPIILGEKDNANTQNWQSRSLWRQVCVAAAMDGGLDDVERAVYGLLSGHLPSVLKVCHSWDDFLFAHYSSFLHYQFDTYLYSKFPERQAALLFNTKLNLETTLLGGTAMLSSKEIMDKMRQSKLTEKESRNPLKIVQASLIAGHFPDCIRRFGRDLIKSILNDSSFDPEERQMQRRLMEFEPSSVDKGVREADDLSLTMQDHNMLRVLTHIQCIFQELGFTAKNDAEQKTIENVFVAYGDFLTKAGKQQLLPLYASKMSPARRPNFLALKLPSVLDTAERQIMLTLLNHYDINILEVLNAQLNLLVFQRLDSNFKRKQNNKLQLLQNAPREGYGGVRFVRDDFLDPTVSGQPIDLIHGFEWLNMLEGNWKRTLSTGVVLYKHFIRRGEFAAGRHLAKTVPFADISLRKTPGILGYEVDLSQHEAYDSGETNGHLDESPGVEMEDGETPQRRRKTGPWLERDVLAQSAALFRDLECLFLALDAMENWAHLASKINIFGKDLGQSKVWRGQIKTAQRALDEALMPIWSPDWLRSSEQENERPGENLAIRDQFLPELLIAYMSALNFYGHAVSREYLVECMDFVAFVADEAKGGHIVETLMRVGRMAEFVEVATRVSREMIAANETLSKGKGARRKSMQKMSLWSVKAPVA